MSWAQEGGVGLIATPMVTRMRELVVKSRWSCEAARAMRAQNKAIRRRMAQQVLRQRDLLRLTRRLARTAGVASGALHETEGQRCPHCKGRGIVANVQASDGLIKTERHCTACGRSYAHVRGAFEFFGGLRPKPLEGHEELPPAAS